MFMPNWLSVACVPVGVLFFVFKRLGKSAGVASRGGESRGGALVVAAGDARRGDERVADDVRRDSRARHLVEQNTERGCVRAAAEIQRAQHQVKHARGATARRGDGAVDGVSQMFFRARAGRWRVGGSPFSLVESAGAEDARREKSRVRRSGVLPLRERDVHAEQGVDVVAAEVLGRLHREVREQHLRVRLARLRSAPTLVRLLCLRRARRRDRRRARTSISSETNPACRRARPSGRRPERRRAHRLWGSSRFLGRSPAFPP
jgi:hypothetical protein